MCLVLFFVCCWVDLLIERYVGALSSKSSKDEGQELVALGHQYSSVGKEPSCELPTSHENSNGSLRF